MVNPCSPQRSPLLANQATLHRRSHRQSIFRDTTSRSYDVAFLKSGSGEYEKSRPSRRSFPSGESFHSTQLVAAPKGSIFGQFLDLLAEFTPRIRIVTRINANVPPEDRPTFLGKVRFLGISWAAGDISHQRELLWLDTRFTTASFAAGSVPPPTLPFESQNVVRFPRPAAGPSLCVIGNYSKHEENNN